jgi:hypothetical protein
MSPVSTAGLVDALRAFRLLEAAQLEEFPALQARFADPAGLVRELVRRGWLTPYQANQVVAGRGDSLLPAPSPLAGRMARSWPPAGRMGRC